MPETNKPIQITLNASTLIIALLVVSFGGYVAYDKLIDGSPINPNTPSPVIPAAKTLRDLVGPTEATQIANFYHDLATSLAFDGPRPEVPNEKQNILTIYDFKQMHQVGFQKFQATQRISGLAAINRPIEERLNIGLGTLKDDELIDDPRLNVRAKLIAICQDIAQELDPEIANYPLGTYR